MIPCINRRELIDDLSLIFPWSTTDLEEVFLFKTFCLKINYMELAYLIIGVAYIPFHRLLHLIQFVKCYMIVKTYFNCFYIHQKSDIKLDLKVTDL